MRLIVNDHLFICIQRSAELIAQESKSPRAQEDADASEDDGKPEMSKSGETERDSVMLKGEIVDGGLWIVKR